MASLCVKESPPSRLRPQAFSASRRFSPPFSLQAYSIPQPCTGFILFRGFSLRAAALPHRKSACPLVVSRTTAHQPRLVATLVRPDFEALLHTKKRCCSLGLTAPQPAPLVRFVSPPGSLPSLLGLQFPRAIHLWRCRPRSSLTR